MLVVEKSIQIGSLVVIVVWIPNEINDSRGGSVC